MSFVESKGVTLFYAHKISFYREIGLTGDMMKRVDVFKILKFDSYCFERVT